MGQYYLAVFLSDFEMEYIRAWMEHNRGAMKLTEHSYLQNKYVLAVEHQLSKEGLMYRAKLVWAGDYADEEPGHTKNLYHIAQDSPSKRMMTPAPEGHSYRYIVNHTLNQYVDKQHLVGHFHPLPLLTADGNGRGGGDFRGDGEDLVGMWRGHSISMEHEPPADYSELLCHFEE